MMNRDLQYLISETKEEKEDSLSSLLNKLKKSQRSQLYAAGKLAGRNLRDIIPELQDYLSKDPCPEAAALIIDAIGQQEINDEFEYTKDGIEYSFWGDMVTPVARSEGFLAAMDLVSTWLMNDEPVLYEMTRKLLIHQAYLYLPLSIDPDEAEYFALGCVKETCELMGEEDMYHKIHNHVVLSKSDME